MNPDQPPRPADPVDDTLWRTRFAMPERVRDAGRGLDPNDPRVPLELPKFLYQINMSKYAGLSERVAAAGGRDELAAMANDPRISRRGRMLMIGHSLNEFAAAYPTYFSNWKSMFGERYLLPPPNSTPDMVERHSAGIRRALTVDPGARKWFAAEFSTPEYQGFQENAAKHARNAAARYAAEARRLGPKISRDQVDELQAMSQFTEPTDQIGFLLQRTDGLAFGDTHTDAALPAFLVDNMAAMARQGVTHLYVEGLDSFDPLDAADIKAVNENLAINPQAELPPAFAESLRKLDMKWNRTPGLVDVALAAHRNGIRIVPMDSYAAMSIKDGGLGRVETMNAIGAATVLQDPTMAPGGKGIILAGTYHVISREKDGNNTPGLSYMTGYAPIKVKAGQMTVMPTDKVFPPMTEHDWDTFFGTLDVQLQAMGHRSPGPPANVEPAATVKPAEPNVTRTTVRTVESTTKSVEDRERHRAAERARQQSNQGRGRTM